MACTLQRRSSGFNAGMVAAALLLPLLLAPLLLLLLLLLLKIGSGTTSTPRLMSCSL